MSGPKAWLDRVSGSLLALLMGAAVLNVVWQVLSRFALGAPSSFTDELARYRAGEKKLMGFFMGQVMRALQGKGDPKAVSALLREKLG